MTGARAAAVAVGVLTLAGLGGHRAGAAAEGPDPTVAGTRVTRESVAPIPSTTSTAPAPVATTTTPAPVATTTTPVPAPADPPPTTAPPPPPPATAEEARGREASSLLSFGLDDLEAYSPGWTVVFLPAMSGYRGLTMPDRRRTEIYVRFGDTVDRLSHTVAHELGHVIDVTASTDATRQAYLAIRGIDPGLTWFGCDGCNDFATPAGDFAETVGHALSSPGYRWKSELAPAPTAEQLAAVRALYRW